jgi:hypothetical protein
MRLSARILKNVVNVNYWQHSNQAHVSEGQPNDVYIQLIDLDWSTKGSPEQSAAFPQYPIRYISQATSIGVKAIFLAIDDDEEFEVVGTQPFLDDKSIWKFELSAAQVPNAGNLKITVTENVGGNNIDKSFIIQSGVSVDLLNRGGC